MSFSQSKVDSTYYEIADYSKQYTSGTVLARMIDGLGFRYYWATEGLSQVDLDYRPNDAVRSTFETMQHIHDLSKIIKNAATQEQNNTSDKKEELDYKELRSATLENFKSASILFLQNKDLSQNDMKFGSNTVPLWNLINGPIEDAVWHCGQISSFRRASGNPINPKINFFSGTVRD